MKLYEIASNYQHVLQLADEGMLDDQTTKDTLEAIGGEFELKAKNCMMIIKKLESDAAGIKAEIDRLKSLKDQTDKSIDSLKDYIKSSMEVMGNDKLDLGIFKLTLKAPTKAVEITDTSLIPADYWRVVPETKAVDKALIATMIKTGKEVPGASLVDGKRALLIK